MKAKFSIKDDDKVLLTSILQPYDRYNQEQFIKIYHEGELRKCLWSLLFDMDEEDYNDEMDHGDGDHPCFLSSQEMMEDLYERNGDGCDCYLEIVAKRLEDGLEEVIFSDINTSKKVNKV